jgi:WD40 repeat protein
VSIRAITWSRDGKLLASAHGTGSPRGNGSIQVWDAQTGKERGTLTGHSLMCLGIDIAPDGKTLASASTDATVKLFDLTVTPRPAVASAAAPTPQSTAK